jgi:hypothetical protein
LLSTSSVGMMSALGERALAKDLDRTPSKMHKCTFEATQVQTRSVTYPIILTPWISVGWNSLW